MKTYRKISDNVWISYGKSDEYLSVPSFKQLFFLFIAIMWYVIKWIMLPLLVINLIASLFE